MGRCRWGGSKTEVSTQRREGAKFRKEIGPMKLRRPTLLETLILLAIAVAAVGLLIPETPWASSGEIKIPVQVHVFDAETMAGIPEAQVAIVRGSSVKTADADAAPYLDRVRQFARTSAQGDVEIPHAFRTGASHNRPQPHAHLSMEWVVVIAEGYGGVVVPVRHSSEPTSSLKENGVLPVEVGLFRCSATEIP